MFLDVIVTNQGTGPISAYRVRFGELTIDIFAADGVGPQAPGWVLPPYWVGVFDGSLDVISTEIVGAVPFPPTVIISVTEAGRLDYFGLRPVIPVVPPLRPFSGNGGGEWPVGDFCILGDTDNDETWLADALDPSDLWLEARRGRERGKRPFKQRPHIRGS